MPYFKIINVEKEELPLFYELYDSRVITDYKVLKSKPLFKRKNGLKENSILYTMKITIDVSHYKFRDNIKTKAYSKILG